METPGILLAAPASGSGKTSAACALMSAFDGMGLNVRACKCGPDYIDPMFHREVIGVESENLDLFFLEKEQLKNLFRRHALGADLVVAEGVMGYYDGMGIDTETGSSYEIAQTLGLPVILVLPGRGAALSLAATAAGMLGYRKESGIKGILINKVSAMLYPKLKQMLETELSAMGYDLPVVGYIPEDDAFALESRHLGLVTPEELGDLKAKIRRGGEILSKTVDLDLLLNIAGFEQRVEKVQKETREEEKEEHGEKIRIGIAKDQAFCFYYKANRELLEQLGCCFVPFSPLKDKTLPEDLDGLMLGGGYPELYARHLSENKEMLQAVAAALKAGIPCLAECGGFMYLHEEMEDEEGAVYPMVSAIRGRCYPVGRLVRFGYISVSDRKGEKTGFLRAGEQIKGHEFHYWDSTENGTDCLAVKPDGKRKWECVHKEGNLFAGYPHLYLPSCPEFAQRFAAACREYGRKRKERK